MTRTLGNSLLLLSLYHLSAAWFSIFTFYLSLSLSLFRQPPPRISLTSHSRSFCKSLSISFFQSPSAPFAKRAREMNLSRREVQQNKPETSFLLRGRPYIRGQTKRRDNYRNEASTDSTFLFRSPLFFLLLRNTNKTLRHFCKLLRLISTLYIWTN